MDTKVMIGGKELLITPAGLSDALALKKAIGRALKGTAFNLPESATAKIDPAQFGDIIGAVLSVDTSDEVETCLFKCAERAAYGPERFKVDREFFEPVERRELYYPIMLEIIKANVGPFFKGIASQLGGLAGSLGITPKP